MEDVVIVSAARTPVGSFNGVFGSVAAHDLGTAAITAAITRAGLEPGDIDEVILGQVLGAAQGQNPARQAARNAGLPDDKTASALTSCAAAACAPWHWRRNRCAAAKAPWWWPAAWKA
jgi:acetyl-CoA acetyltransferase